MKASGGEAPPQVPLHALSCTWAAPLLHGFPFVSLLRGQKPCDRMAHQTRCTILDGASTWAVIPCILATVLCQSLVPPPHPPATHLEMGCPPLRVTMNRLVHLLRARVRCPLQYTPQGVQEGRPPAVAPPMGWSTGFMATPRTCTVVNHHGE